MDKTLTKILIEGYPSLLEGSIFMLKGSEGGQIYTVKTFLLGLIIEKESINVGPFTLRKYNKKVDNHIEHFEDGCILELKYRDRKPVNLNQETPQSIYVEPSWLVESFFLAIQLMVDGRISMSKLYYFNENSKMVGTFKNIKWLIGDSPINEPKPIIHEIDKDEMLFLMRSIYGKCSIAISRYNRACSEIIEDGLIHFIIAIENLLIHRRYAGELTHQISKRGALLLAEKDEEKESYYYAIKYLYDLRSRFIHGEKEGLLEFPQEVEKKNALTNLGITVKDIYHDRFHIIEFTRKITQKLLLIFIKNEDKLNEDWLLKLELGIKTRNNIK